MKNLVKSITGLIIILSGLNMGLVGLFDYNAIQAIFATMPAVLKAVNIIVGLSALVYGYFQFTENRMFQD